MTIEMQCGGCGRPIGVGEEHVGKLARCPVCGHINQVPGPAASPATAEALASWMMRTPEGQVFGPTDRPGLDRWVAEGRVSWDCQLKQGQSGWRNASELYPMLRPPGNAPPPANPLAGAATAWAAPAGTPAGQQPQRDFVEARSPSQYPANPSGPLGQAAPLYTGVSQDSPYASEYRPTYVNEHRAFLIVTLAVMSWIIPCFGFVLAPTAWVLAAQDAREMRQGRMNPDGLTATNIGMAIAIVHCVFVAAGMLFLVAMVALN